MNEGYARERKASLSESGPFEDSMLDLVMLTIGLGFFAAAALYLHSCDRL